MKTNENQKSTNHSTTAQKPFFGAAPEHAFFSAERAPSTPFFQPKAVWQPTQQAKSATSEAEGITQPLVQRMPAFESELIAQRTEQRSLFNSPQQLSASPIQAKLTIGEPGDKYEQEADRVASQVVEQINVPASAQSTQGRSVQRQEEQPEELQAKPEITALQRQEEKPEELQAKPEITILQRQEEKPEELQAKPEITALQRQEEKPEELQAKSTQQRAIAAGEASTDLTSAINSARGGGQAIADNIREPMEQAFGADFSQVKVHTDGQSDQLNRSIQARAFTTGQDVFFRSGEYNPGSRGGQELLAHELTHVVQQNGGAVMRSPVQAMPGGGRSTVQRAGDYKGLLPGHETYKDSYKYKDEQSTAFTYHHIIPENKLHDVLKKLKVILLGDLTTDDGQSLNSEVKGLKENAREQWLATRAKDTTSAINKKFSDYKVVVDETKIKDILKQHTTLDPLFNAVEKLIREQLKAKFGTHFTSQKGKLKNLVSDLLKKPESDWMRELTPIVDGITFENRPIFQIKEVADIFKTAPQPIKGTRKASIINALEKYSKTITFEIFYRAAYPQLHEHNVSSDEYLKRLLRDNGLPREDQDELEDAVTWNPGNIHRGPDSQFRLNPKDKEDFNKYLDDGGNQFEIAAKNLVKSDHYEQLSELNKDLDNILLEDSPDTLSLAVNIVKQMQKIQKMGLTDFDQNAWKEIKVGDRQKMRVKTVEEKAKDAVKNPKI